MRRLVALAVAPIAVAAALAVPAPAAGVQSTSHHKSWHQQGGDDSMDPAPPVLQASATRVAPGAAVKLTATAETEIIGGTWKVRDAGGDWRRLATWSSPDAHTGVVTKDVTARKEAGTRSFKLVAEYQDGSSVSNRVTVESVVDSSPSEPGSEEANRFRAVTWNVYYGTPVTELRPILRRLLADGVSVFLMQEMSNPDARRMLEQEGLDYHYVSYQWVVAWDPDVWSARDTWGKRLSPTSFVREDGRGPIYVDSALAHLEDRAGRTLEVMSYHLPPNVQVTHPQPERLQIHREAAASWRRLVGLSTADAMLYGGDDNVDENNGYLSGTSFWDYMRRSYTGLRQVVAPTGTISRYRRIDDFRTRGLLPGTGYTGNGGGDHKFFVSDFTWR